MNKVWLVSGMVAGSIVVAALLVAGRDLLGNAADTTQGQLATAAPWEIELLPGGRSRVMGLVLGGQLQDQPPASTLADAQRLWGPLMQVAVVASPQETGSLEAYIDPAQLGAISGKLVLTLSATPPEISQMRERASKVEFMESTTRRFNLSAADLAQAQSRLILSAAFVPQAQLDEATVIARFGRPAQRLRPAPDTGVEHFLYPDKGLDLALNPKGKEVLQYVAPAQFDRLRQPLTLTP